MATRYSAIVFRSDDALTTLRYLHQRRAHHRFHCATVVTKERMEHGIAGDGHHVAEVDVRSIGSAGSLASAWGTW